MRPTIALVAAAALSVCSLFAAKDDPALKQAAFTFEDTPASFYIWADKYVYQPGEPLTLRWTITKNDDNTAYTFVAYRQNNQTGEIVYLPGNSTAATDIFGNSLEKGFEPVLLPEGAKQVLVGESGSILSSPLSVPDQLGMHTLVLELRDATGARVVKKAYFKIGVVSGFEDITGDITADRHLVNTKAYRLSGVVFVKNNATLRIDPGTFILGQPGSLPPSALIISVTSKIIAEGTRSRPIVMTSSRPFGQRERGDWGGLAMVGKAPVNWPEGRGDLEGLPPSADTSYGGTDVKHNCGSLKYVRIEYAGAVLSPNNELNSFTWGGCGTDTVADHLQAIYGQDDSFEWFGGSMNSKYLVGAFGKDDYFDWQIGFTGKIQYGVAYVSDKIGSNRGFEGDNNERDFDLAPRSSPQFYNMTLVGNPTSPDDEVNQIAGIWTRRGTGGSINNTLITNWNQTGIEIRDAATANAITNNQLTVNGLLLWDNGKNLSPAKENTIAGQTNSANTPAAVAPALLELLQGTRGTGKNVIVANPLLRRPFSYSDPDFRPAVLSPAMRAGWVAPPDDGFFDQAANFIGAFGQVNWMEEWTNFLRDEDIR